MKRSVPIRCTIGLAAVTASELALADGGISAIGALLDVMLLFLGIVGIVVIPMMLGTTASLARNERVTIGAGFVLALAILYVPIAGFFALAGSESSYFWIPAVTGIAVLVLIIRFFRRRR